MVQWARIPRGTNTKDMDSIPRLMTCVTYMTTQLGGWRAWSTVL